MFKPSLLSNAVFFSILPSIIMTVGICLYTVYHSNQKQDALLERQVTTLLDAVSYISETGLKEKRPSTLAQQLRNIHARSSLPVYRIKVFSANGRLFAASKADEKPHRYETRQLIDSQKILYANSDENTLIPIGEVIITLDVSGEVYDKFTSNLNVIIMLILAVVLTSIIMLTLVNKLLKPLNAFVGAVKRIGSGDLKYRLDTPVEYELNELKEGINRMAEQLYDNQSRLESEIEEATRELQHNLLLVEEKNAELDIARKEAEEGSKIKSEFLATMSHEVRTPLNAIVGFTNELKKAKLPQPYADYVAIMHKSTDSLMAIVNDILDFSKIEAGKMELDQSTFRLGDTIEDVVKLMARDAFAKNLVFSYEADRIPTTAIGDERRFKQIITNLLSNAIKFTREGFVILRIHLEPVSQSQKYLIIEVEDSGIGIDIDKQKKLFTAFQQADASTTREYGGTGLGLAITYGLVQQMNGHMRLTSQAGHGACFTITLPITTSQGETQSPLSDIQSALIFDPHVITAASYQKLFEQSAAIVDVCHDIEQWEDKINGETQYDLIVIASDCDEESIELTPLQAGFANKNQADAFIVLAVPLYTSLPEQSKANLKDWPVCEKPFTLTRLKTLWQRNARRSDKKVAQLNPTTAVDQIQHTSGDAQIKMLAVDDNETNLKLLSAILRDQKVELTTASQGSQAVNLCQNNAYDLILMDVQMPNMDGVEACRLIRQSQLNQQTPVIAFTAHAFKEEREKLLRSGMDDYLAKPIDMEKFNRLVNKWVTSTSRKNQPQAVKAQKNETDTRLQTIDWTLCLQKANHNEDIAKELLAMLIDSFKHVKSDIEKCYQAQDHSELLEVIHKFHGSTCYSGVPRLRSLTNRLESQLKKGILLNIDKLVEQLLAEMEAVTRAFTEYKA
ncbi:response regulator [Gayadomonas joobiniege]|uniref:response regulator n=1 Tax=Gayadomonas joobiniege TaxID=1234606 RepID=UPI0003643155|nr:response regulator [Gayadomonas joobiniege]